MNYLFDCCPHDFRGCSVLHRHPLVLAQFARHFVAGQVRATYEGLADVRTGLAGFVPPDVLDEAVQGWLEQQARLARTRRAVGLIEDALRGTIFVPRL